ncbi:MAG TPA: triose-phosphate isomerase [Bacteroidales bacterium]|nr:triose-phosphate isomerase [Bacteroidales bacterium]HRZ47817.1 triose-phosphate isomerase [Bacteroidales bacterium]
MTRTKIVAGNWKLHKLYHEGIDLAEEICSSMAAGIRTRSGEIPKVVLAPPYHLLNAVAGITAGVTGVYTAAQNAAAEISGAFTGEVSAQMIASAGAGYVIIGHSERRTLFGEDDAVLSRKLVLSLEAGLIPIYCIGEVLAQRLANAHFEVVLQQLKSGVFHLEEEAVARIVIAYEPVWAIGTGHTATPDQAEEMHAFIRRCFAERYHQAVADNLTILYGGSCKPDNAAELFSQPDVDGGLIGGASLKAADFLAIVKSV